MTSNCVRTSTRIATIFAWNITKLPLDAGFLPRKNTPNTDVMLSRDGITQYRGTPALVWNMSFVADKGTCVRTDDIAIFHSATNPRESRQVISKTNSFDVARRGRRCRLQWRGARGTGMLFVISFRNNSRKNTQVIIVSPLERRSVLEHATLCFFKQQRASVSNA